MSRDVFPKWIVEDDSLIIGKCTNHHQLAVNPTRIKGGGWWHMAPEANIILLYGSSADYGYAPIDAVAEAIQAQKAGTFADEDHFKDYIFMYSTRYKLEDAKQDCVVIPNVKPVKEDAP